MSFVNCNFLPDKFHRLKPHAPDGLELYLKAYILSMLGAVACTCPIALITFYFGMHFGAVFYSDSTCRMLYWAPLMAFEGFFGYLATFHFATMALLYVNANGIGL